MNKYYNTDKIFSIEDLKIEDYAFILLAWRRRSGKSVICKNLLKKICDDFSIDFIVVFWKTNKYNHDYDFIKKNHNCKINDYDEKTPLKIQKIIDSQDKKFKNNINCVGLILFDDITQHKTNDYIWEFATSGRHLKLFVILWCQQWKKVVTTTIRGN